MSDGRVARHAPMDVAMRRVALLPVPFRFAAAAGALPEDAPLERLVAVLCDCAGDGFAGVRLQAIRCAGRPVLVFDVAAAEVGEMVAVTVDAPSMFSGRAVWCDALRMWAGEVCDAVLRVVGMSRERVGEVPVV